MFYCDLFKKKKLQNACWGFGICPAVFFLCCTCPAFQYKLNNNKYTFMKKLYFYFFFLTVKGGFYTNFLERGQLKESFQQRKSINNYRRKTAA